MSLLVITEVWDALRDYIDMNERTEAADTLVNYLMDSNYEVDDIKDAFKDKDITKALKGYAEQHFQEEDYEEDEEDEDSDEDSDW
jgi:hypothetical protein